MAMTRGLGAKSGNRNIIRVRIIHRYDISTPPTSLHMLQVGSKLRSFSFRIITMYRRALFDETSVF